MEKTGIIDKRYAYTASARLRGNRWVPALIFAGKVLAFPGNLSFESEEQAIACAEEKAHYLAVPPLVHRTREKRKKNDEAEE